MQTRNISGIRINITQLVTRIRMLAPKGHVSCRKTIKVIVPGVFKFGWNICPHSVEKLLSPLHRLGFCLAEKELHSSISFSHIILVTNVGP